MKFDCIKVSLKQSFPRSKGYQRQALETDIERHFANQRRDHRV